MSIEPDAATYAHAAQLISLQRQQTHKRTGEVKGGTRYFTTSLRAQETTAPRCPRPLYLPHGCSS